MPELVWKGKTAIVEHHLSVPVCELLPVFACDAKGVKTERDTALSSFQNLTGLNATGVNADNKILHGDNLLALKALLPEYENRVKCIYIDPPYNTGNEGWVYNDNVNSTEMRSWLGRTVGKAAEDLNRHDKWLCMLYPRLKLLHQLLADNGAIFISIDDNEQHHLRMICDEIFGERNFVANVIWQHSIQPKGYLGKFSIHHNHTIIYSKSNSFSLGNLVRTEEHNKAYSNNDNDPRGLWRTGDVRNALYRPNLIYDIITPSGKTIEAPKNGWRWSKETLNNKISIGEIIFNKTETNIIKKIYLDNIEGRAPETIWFGQEVGTTRDANKTLKELFDNELPFDTPKPVTLIERIIQLSSTDNDIILDSFAGSGTTAHAVINLNHKDGGKRKYILVQMDETDKTGNTVNIAENITAERVRRVLANKATEAEAELDFDENASANGFVYYDIGAPLFLEDKNINPAASVAALRQYIWCTETRNAADAQPAEDTEEAVFYLGTNAQTAYYFCYDGSSEIVLDWALLQNLLTHRPETAHKCCIYADNCLLPDDLLLKYGITFKKIPRHIVTI